jgi:hypothetical protein
MQSIDVSDDEELKSEILTIFRDRKQPVSCRKYREPLSIIKGKRNIYVLSLDSDDRDSSQNSVNGGMPACRLQPSEMISWMQVKNNERIPRREGHENSPDLSAEEITAAL